MYSGCSRKLPPEVAKNPIEQGWQYYQAGDFDRAILSFELAEQQAGNDSTARAKALYALATTWWQKRPDPDRDRATDLYQQVIQIDPKSDLAAWSALGIARIVAFPEMTKDARLPEAAVRKGVDAYEKVVTQYGDYSVADEALVLQQSLKLATLKPEDVQQVVDRLTQFVTEKPQSKYLSHAWAVLGIAYEYQGRWQDQLNAMIQSYEKLEIDPDVPIMVKPSVFWSIATVAEFKAGDFATARKFYRLLQEKFPRDALLFSTELALKRMDEKEEELRRSSPTQPQIR